MGPQSSIPARVACALAAILSLSSAADAATRDLPAGGDLQAALNTAQPGDVIQLAAGATYVGNFKLPMTAGTDVITIRSGGGAGVPPGVRVTPAAAASLAKIKSPNGSPALSTADGAHHWRIEGVEFMANAKGAGDIIALGNGSQTDVALMPHDLILDRVYVHGDPAVGQKRGIALNSGSTQILNSYVADIKAVGADSQAIGGWNGSGPYVIENNYLEAAGENVMFGGADPAVWSLVPSDITFRRNVLSKPLAWRQESWSVKNVFELKNARRVLVEGNVIENVWKAGQAGFAVQLTPRNQDGKAPWSVVEDVTFRDNIIRHAGSAFNLSGWDDLQASAQMRRVQIVDNLVYDIDGATWGGSGIFVQIGNSPADIVVEHNTVINSGTVVNVYGKKNGAPWMVDGFAFRDNLSRHNDYGVMGDGQSIGQGTIAAFFSRVIFERNVLAGGAASRYPAGNYFPTVAEFNASFVNLAGDDLNLVPGSAFRTMGAGGSVLGADVARVNATVSGVQVPLGATSGSTVGAGNASGDRAVCSAGSADCRDMTPFARRRR